MVQQGRRRLVKDWSAYLYPIGTGLFVLAVWEVGVRVLSVPGYILPPPSTVVARGVAGAPDIWPHFLITFFEAALGLIGAILVAVPVGLFFSYSPFLRRAFYPLFVFFDEIPKVAFAPILVIWFGFGLEPKVLLTFINCFFPIFLNSLGGFANIEDETVNLARSAGAREWEMFWKIRLQSALPFVFVGLKLASASAMTGAVIAEFLAADRGLGLFLQRALSQLDMGLGLATIAAMWGIGLILFYGMVWIESRAIRWHVSRRGRQNNLVMGGQ